MTKWMSWDVIKVHHLGALLSVWSCFNKTWKEKKSIENKDFSFYKKFFRLFFFQINIVTFIKYDKFKYFLALCWLVNAQTLSGAPEKWEWGSSPEKYVLFLSDLAKPPWAPKWFRSEEEQSWWICFCVINDRLRYYLVGGFIKFHIWSWPVQR